MSEQPQANSPAEPAVEQPQAATETKPTQGPQGAVWHVREARAGEESDIGRIQRDAMVEVLLAVHKEEAAGLAQTLDADQMGRAWAEPVHSGIQADRGVLVAEDDGDVVGFTSFYVDPTPLPENTPVAGVTVDPGAAQLLAFEVDSKHRNRGHGSRMLSAIADTCRENKIPGLAMWIVAQDDPKLKFFQTAGFAPVGVRRYLQTPAGDVVEHLWYAEL